MDPGVENIMEVFAKKPEINVKGVLFHLQLGNYICSTTRVEDASHSKRGGCTEDVAVPV